MRRVAAPYKCMPIKLYRFRGRMISATTILCWFITKRNCTRQFLERVDKPIFGGFANIKASLVAREVARSAGGIVLHKLKFFQKCWVFWTFITTTPQSRLSRDSSPYTGEPWVRAMTDFFDRLTALRQQGSFLCSFYLKLMVIFDCLSLSSLCRESRIDEAEIDEL